MSTWFAAYLLHLGDANLILSEKHWEAGIALSIGQTQLEFELWEIEKMAWSSIFSI